MAVFGPRRSRAAKNDEALVFSIIVEHASTVLPGSSLDAGSGELIVPLATDRRARVATGEVVAHALSRPEPERVDIVRAWLAEIAEALRAGIIGDDGAGAPAAADLRLRVMPTWAPDTLAAVTSQPVPVAFDAIVVFTGRDRWEYLPPSQAQAFGGAVEAAGTAVRQTITEELHDVDVRDHDLNGFQLRMVAKDGCPFVTTALLSLRRFMPQPVDDALVIAPRYSAIALLPLTAKDEIRIATVLAGVARDMYANAPDQCSAGVYWWHDGTFHPLDLDDDGTVVLEVELAAVAAALA